MSYTYIVDELLSYIKQFGMIPASQENFSDDLILTIADYQITTIIAPLLKSIDNTFYVENADYDFVNGQAAYVMPEFAMWNSVKQINKLYNNNNLGLVEYITTAQLPFIDLSTAFEPSYFYILGNNINFAPPPNLSASQMFRVQYWRRPGKLVTYEIKDNIGTVTGYGAAKVQAINYTTGEVTYEQLPPASYTSGSYHDFYSSNSPFTRLQTRAQATALATNVQTFPAASVATLKVGDFVNLTGETVFTAIPAELREMLVKLVLKQIAKAQVDVDRYQLEAQEIAEQYKITQQSPGTRLMSQPIALTLSMNSKVMMCGPSGF